MGKKWMSQRLPNTGTASMKTTTRVVVERETANTLAIMTNEKKKFSRNGSQTFPSKNGWSAISSNRAASRYANLQDGRVVLDDTDLVPDKPTLEGVVDVVKEALGLDLDHPQHPHQVDGLAGEDG